MIEIQSKIPGKLYGGITIDDLLTGNYTSKSRNKLIAKIFKEAGLIERYGSGLIRVRQICKDKTIKRYVLKLKQKGLLQRIGPDKGAIG